MAVPTSSNCNALPAYLMYFKALATSSELKETPFAVVMKLFPVRSAIGDGVWICALVVPRGGATGRLVGGRAGASIWGAEYVFG